MMCLHRCSYQLWMQPRNIVPSSECVPSALMQPMYDGCGFWQQGVFSNSTKFSALKRKTFSQQELSYWFEIFLNAMVGWKSCKLFSFRKDNWEWEEHLRKHPINFYCNQFLREMFGENWQMQLTILLQNAPVDEFKIRAQGYNMCWQIMSFQIFTSSRSFAKSTTFFYFLIKAVWKWYMNRKAQITASTGISKPKSCLYVRSK